MQFHAKYPLFVRQSDREFTFSYAIIYETAYAGENVFEAFKQRYSDKLVRFQLLYSFSNWNQILSNCDTNYALMNLKGLVKNVAIGFDLVTWNVNVCTP